jgi:hypothetical protein
MTWLSAARVLACAGVVAAWGSALGQQFAYNTFSGNFQYEILAGSTISGSQTTPGYTDTANKFISALSGNISDLWVAMAYNSAGPNVFDINLRADANNAPGAIIHSWTLVDQAFPFNPEYHDPVHVIVTDPVPLAAGTAYWLEMHAGDPASWLVWDFTRPPLFQTVAQRFTPGGGWNVLNPGFTSAYAIAVPGPGAWALLLLGAGMARRRARL